MYVGLKLKGKMSAENETLGVHVFCLQTCPIWPMCGVGVGVLCVWVQRVCVCVHAVGVYVCVCMCSYVVLLVCALCFYTVEEPAQHKLSTCIHAMHYY